MSVKEGSMDANCWGVIYVLLLLLFLELYLWFCQGSQSSIIPETMHWQTLMIYLCFHSPWSGLLNAAQLLYLYLVLSSGYIIDLTTTISFLYCWGLEVLIDRFPRLKKDLKFQWYLVEYIRLTWPNSPLMNPHFKSLDPDFHFDLQQISRTPNMSDFSLSTSMKYSLRSKQILKKTQYYNVKWKTNIPGSAPKLNGLFA